LTITIAKTSETTMQFDIQARNFSLTKALRDYIEKRIRFALDARDEHIQRVMVRLSDINGPRGGEDMCCHIQIILPHLPDVVIEDTEADMYVAIDKASDRAGCTVGRRLTRQRDRERSHRPQQRPEPTELEALN